MSLVTTPEELDQIRRKLQQSTLVSVDTETTFASSEPDRKIIGFSIYTDLDDSWYIPVGHEAFMPGERGTDTNLQPPTDLLRGLQGKTIVFHNAAFDLKQLEKVIDISYLLAPETTIYCTLVMGAILDENESHMLEDMAARYTGERKLGDLAKAMKGKDKAEWPKTPPSVMAVYAEQDTKATYNLYLALRPLFTEYEEYWKIEGEFLKLLHRMSSKGIPVDLTFCREQLQACWSRQQEIQRELGFDPSKPSQVHRKLFSLPPEGLGLIPSSFTPKTGKPQVNEAYLETVSHPIAGLLLEYSGLVKAASAYFKAYINHADRYGRIHATYKQYSTVTGRLSCAEPNLQQIPRDGIVKQAFNPEPGHELWELDYSNIEYRLMAVYSKDPDLIERFEAGADFHTIVADRLGIPRHKAKTLNFALGYGAGVPGVQKALGPGTKVAEAKKRIDEYWAGLKLLKRVSDQAQQVAEANMQIKYWSGRYRHFKYPSEARKAFNSVIQGGAFEIVKRAMLMLDEAGFDIRNQVHDSVWLMIPEGQADVLVPKAQSIMSDWTKEAFGLTFTTDAKRLK